MSANSWVHFFRDAGIPSSAAKSYAAIFEENRISKDMLLDLDKGILGDMGIKIMGDVISILKQAKKEVRKKDQGRTSTSVSSSAQTPTVSTTSVMTKKAQKPPNLPATEVPADSWAQDPVTIAMVTGACGPQEPSSYVPYEESETEATTRQLLEAARVLQPHILLAAQAQLQADAEAQVQAQVEQLAEGGIEFFTEEGSAMANLVSPVARIETGLEERPAVEEYTTAAYENLMSQRKRPHGSLYSDGTEVFVDTGTSPPKQPRLALRPAEGRDTYHSPSTGDSDRTRRLLEATNLFSQTPPTKDKPSVFARLGQSSSSSSLLAAPIGTSSSSSSSRTAAIGALSVGEEPKAAAKPQRTVQVGKPGSASPLEARERLTVVRKVAKTSPSTTVRAVKTSPSSSVAARKVVKKPVSPPSVKPMASSTVRRVPVKPQGDTRGLSVTTTTSRLKLSERLGARGGREQLVTARSGKGASQGRQAGAQTSALASSLSQQARERTHSMVADEYETKRQLDIRSRLEQKEKEKTARRRQPLAGRLEKHHVFGRLE